MLTVITGQVNALPSTGADADPGSGSGSGSGSGGDQGGSDGQGSHSKGNSKEDSKQDSKDNSKYNSKDNSKNNSKRSDERSDDVSKSEDNGKAGYKAVSGSLSEEIVFAEGERDEVMMTDAHAQSQLQMVHAAVDAPANGAARNGAAANGATPNGAIANGATAKGTAANGTAADPTALWGLTPLHVAIKKRAEDVVKVLLAAGADPLRENSAGVTPRDMAKKLRAGAPILVAVEGAAVAREEELARQASTALALSEQALSLESLDEDLAIAGVERVDSKEGDMSVADPDDVTRDGTVLPTTRKNSRDPSDPSEGSRVGLCYNRSGLSSMSVFDLPNLRDVQSAVDLPSLVDVKWALEQ
jgi:hypothetical protein